jgi:hypothetical protein
MNQKLQRHTGLIGGVTLALFLSAGPAMSAEGISPEAEKIVRSTAAAAGEPIEVQVALQIDQITEIDQKAENFTVVASYIMSWTDAAYAFDAVECGCDKKIYTAGQFEDFANENSLNWPRFVIHNQQGNRWIQESIFRVFPDGRIAYGERFTVTLQAPDFNFLEYPFDTQKFAVHVVSIYPDDLYRFLPHPDYNRMGTDLGEEEWLVGDYGTQVGEIDSGTAGTRTQFTFSFQAKRHVEYYVFRIFLPLFLIILVAYATFFMKDYAKRVDYSAANLLTFVMFNFAVGSDLPRLGYLTFVDNILAIGFVMTAVTVMANVAQKRLSVTGKEEVARRWDGMILWGYPLLYGFGWGVTWYVYFVRA